MSSFRIDPNSFENIDPFKSMVEESFRYGRKYIHITREGEGFNLVCDSNREGAADFIQVSQIIDEIASYPKVDTKSLQSIKQVLGQIQYDRAFLAFPKEHFFRLYIDRARQDEGHRCFDVKEPGYEVGMLKGFSYVRDHIGIRMDAKGFEELHDVCIDNVKMRDFPFQKGYQFGSAYKWDKERSASPIAIQEWEEEKLIDVTPRDEDKETGFLSRKFSSDIGSSFDSPDALPQCKEKINELFETYYKDIKLAKSDEGELLAIVKLCRALEIYHPFRDGNQRTIVFCLLNKLLIENNFSPVILEDPVVFDGYLSAEELVDAVKKGMQTFEAYKVV